MVIGQSAQNNLRAIFNEQNPWHASGTVPEELAPPAERSLAKVLWMRLTDDQPYRHQVILGPRRVGKTTVMYQTVRHLIADGTAPTNIWWLRLDHPWLAGADLGEIVSTLLDGTAATRTAPLYLMLDEVVYTKHWDAWLKTFYDDRWPVRVVATSSGTAALRQQRHESGIGRWDEHHLLPCLLDEFLSLTGGTSLEHKQSLNVGAALASTLASHHVLPPPTAEVAAARRQLLMTGGFPQLFVGRSPVQHRSFPNEFESLVLRSQRMLRSDAVERAVYKDIPQAASVGSPMSLERLLYVLADAICGILSPQGISRDLGITEATLERYLSHLEQAYLVFTLTNYSGTERRVQRRGRKLFFTDTAVRNATLHRGLAPLDNPAEQGTLLENLVATSVRSLALHAGVRLHYWRDGNDEVDLVYDDPAQPLAFEIASSGSHRRSGLEALIGRYPKFRGHSYLIAPQAGLVPADRSPSGIGTLPLDTFLLTVGIQAHRAMLNRLGVAQAETPPASAGIAPTCPGDG